MVQAFSEMGKTLAQRRGAACESEAVRATVALTRGVEGLDWVKSRRGMNDTAMTNRARLKTVAATQPDDVRMEKVERLRAAIASGSYGVSSEALADKLMEHMRELGEREPIKRK